MQGWDSLPHTWTCFSHQSETGVIECTVTVDLANLNPWMGYGIITYSPDLGALLLNAYYGKRGFDILYPYHQ